MEDRIVHGDSQGRRRLLAADRFALSSHIFVKRATGVIGERPDAARLHSQVHDLILKQISFDTRATSMFYFGVSYFVERRDVMAEIEVADIYAGTKSSNSGTQPAFRLFRQGIHDRAHRVWPGPALRIPTRLASERGS